MFKVATHSFQYYLSNLSEEQILAAYQSYEGRCFCQISSNTKGKPIVWKIKSAWWQDGKFICNIQVNYQNDLTQDIVSNAMFNENLGLWENAWQNNQGVLSSDQTPLVDIFLVFCFTNLPFNINQRETQNLKRGFMFAIYDGRYNLVSTVLRKLEDDILSNYIQNITPVFRDSMPLNAAIDFISSIKISWLLDRDGRKTWMSILVSNETLWNDIGLLDRLTQTISDIMWDTVWAIKASAKVFWRQTPITTNTTWERILQSIPEILALNEDQSQMLSNFTEAFNQKAAIRTFDFISLLNNLTTNILNSWQNE